MLAHAGHSLLYAIPAVVFLAGLAVLTLRDRRRARRRRPGWKVEAVRERARARGRTRTKR